MGPLEMLAFALFVAMLAGLLALHHHKLQVVALGFLALAVLFISQHGFPGFGSHFAEPHRSHLLINLALLLPGFALVAHYFEHSGASHGMARVLKTDTLVLWSIFWLSTILDNIAAAMIGGTVFLALYGQNTPFRLLVGVICASNLGGAGSPVGDTTTVMMFISEDPKIAVLEIFAGFIATLPAMLIITAWAVRHGQTPGETRDVATVVDEAAHRPSEDDVGTGHDDAVALAAGEKEKGIRWGMVLTLLAIPGLIVGNIIDQPGLGLWTGIIAGLLLGRTRFNAIEMVKALPNTLFLVTLVAAAELLPLEQAKPYLDTMSRDVVAVLFGLLSAWFDNIPLTAIGLQLKEFDWGLLAYCVGYGGSAMWFGSSAGVALGLLFPQIYNTKQWKTPFLMVTLSYLAGAAFYLAVFRGTGWVLALPKFEGMMLALGLTFAAWAGAGYFELGRKDKRNLAPIIGLGLLGGATLMLAFFILAN